MLQHQAVMQQAGLGFELALVKHSRLALLAQLLQGLASTTKNTAGVAAMQRSLGFTPFSLVLKFGSSGGFFA